MKIDRPSYFTGIEAYISGRYAYMCPEFTYTEEGHDLSVFGPRKIDATMHISLYGGTQLRNFTVAEIKGLPVRWVVYVDAAMGIIDWQHVSAIMNTIPCVNHDWITKVRDTTEVGMVISRIREENKNRNSY